MTQRPSAKSFEQPASARNMYSEQTNHAKGRGVETELPPPLNACACVDALVFHGADRSEGRGGVDEPYGEVKKGQVSSWRRAFF
jgi:hypothetical protein